jgi:hypothetical protein
MKKVIFPIVTLVAILIPISCENFKLLVDCEKCYTDLPDKYSLELKITIDSENTSVPITLYKGKINSGEIIDVDTVYANPYYSIEVEFGEYYSAIARYRHNGRVIYAVDGQKLSKKLDESSCNESCYVISGDMLDLRLK